MMLTGACHPFVGLVTEPSARRRRYAELRRWSRRFRRTTPAWTDGKITAALKRAGSRFGRDQTGRLMRELGLVGITGQPQPTTVLGAWLGHAG